MLRALRALQEAPIHLVVIGAGPQLEPLQNIARELGVAENVTFTGWVEEMRKWELLRAANAYISTSMHEGFGLVFIEGMAMGLPVIAPDHGGQVEFLRDGETGFITPAGDDDAVVDAIRSMVAAPDEVERMSRNAVALAREFRPEQCAERYEAVFERAIANRVPHR
jgi:glycosyltransferase involved in cell wall biosynthesis